MANAHTQKAVGTPTIANMANMTGSTPLASYPTIRTKISLTTKSVNSTVTPSRPNPKSMVWVLRVIAVLSAPPRPRPLRR